MGRNSCGCTSSYKCGYCIRTTYSSCRVYNPCSTGCKPKCEVKPTCDTKPDKLELEILLARLTVCCADIPILREEFEQLKIDILNGAEGYQLVANMVSSLDGDLTDKYPSALLLLGELQKLWECIYTRHKHYGEWTSNVVTQTVIDSNDNCLVEGENSVDILSQVKIDVGDTVTHNGSVWESLCEDNDTEPVVGDCWLNLSTLAIPTVEEIDCNMVGFLQFDTCAEMEAYTGTDDCPLLDGQLGVTTDNDCFELYKFVVGTTVTPIDVDNCDFQVGSVVSTTSKWVNYLYCNGVEPRLTDLEECCEDRIAKDNEQDGRLDAIDGTLASQTGLPVGAITFVSTVSGTYSQVVDGNYTDTTGVIAGSAWTPVDNYEFLDATKTFTKVDYPYLATVGKKVHIELMAAIGYFVDMVSNTIVKSVQPYQWGTRVYINGALVHSSASDGYALNKSGHNSGLADSASFEFITNNTDMEVRFVYVLTAGTNATGYNIGDSLEVDMGVATISFIGEV